TESRTVDVTPPIGFIGAGPSGIRQRRFRRSAAIQLFASVRSALAPVVSRARHSLRRLSIGEGPGEAHRAAATADSLELSARARWRHAGGRTLGHARQSDTRHLES